MSVVARIALVAGLGMLSSPGWSADASAPDLFKQRCATCHLADGAGVPSAYPRLAGRIDGLIREDQGRQYVVMVVSKGLMGSLDVDGSTVTGVMPPQSGLSDAEVANLLNGLAAMGTSSMGSRPYDAQEVARIRATHAALDMQGVGALRPANAGKAK